jgi:hypothetical protein
MGCIPYGDTNGDANGEAKGEANGLGVMFI